MPIHLLNTGLARRRCCACLALAASLAGLPSLAAQTMTLDETYHPQFRARARLAVHPQSDGNLAGTGVDYLGETRAPAVFRFAPDGTVLSDDGPRVVITHPGTDLLLDDGRRVTGTIHSEPISWENSSFHAIIATRDAAGALLGEMRLELATIPLGLGVSVLPQPALQLVALPDGRVMVGGASGFVRINVDGTRDTSFAAQLPEGAGPFRDMIALPDGSIVAALGGTVSTTDFATRITGPATLHRIRADGTPDPAYSLVVDEPALHAALPDGGLIVGTTRLTRVRPDGTADVSFGPAPAALARILSVRVLTGGNLLVSGGYADDRPSVFVLGPDGSLVRDLRDLFPEAHAVALDGLDASGNAWVRHGPAGGIYLDWRGEFQVNVNRASHARVPVSGTHPALFTPFPLVLSQTPASAGTIERMSMDAAGRLVVSGSFDSIDGAPRPGVARILADGTLDPGFDPAELQPEAWLAYPHDDGRMLVRDRNGLRRLRDDGSIEVAFAADCALATHTSLSIRALSADGNYLGIVNSGDPGDAIACEVRCYSAQDGALLAATPNPGGIIQLQGLAALADGRILISGTHALPTDGPYTYGQKLARLLADGTVDATYRNVLPALARVSTLTLFPDGSAIAAVDWPNDLTTNTTAVRLNADGTLDPSFRLSDFDAKVVDALVEPLADGGFLAWDWSFQAIHRWRRDGRHAATLPRAIADSVGNLLITTGDVLYAAGPHEFDGGAILSPLRRYLPTHTPGITAQPFAPEVIAGSEVLLEVAVGDADAGNASYQWQRDGVDIPGATEARLVIERVAVGDAGAYRCIIQVGSATYVSEAAPLTVESNTTRVVNFSARSRVEPGRPQIAGMVIEPGASQPALLRAVGSALPFDLGVPLLWDPVLTLYDRESPIAHDHGGIWRTEILELGDQLGAFRPRVPAPRPGDPVIAIATNSALATTLAPGLYTAHTSAGNGEPGVSLFEYYDAAPATISRSVCNISIRGVTGPGSEVLVAGFVVRGTGNIRLLIRAIGPSLAGFGVSEPVADPRIIVRAFGTSGPDATNDNWGGAPSIVAAAEAVSAFTLDPTSKDAALVVTLPSGAYTVQIPAAGDQRGEVLAEIYVLEP